MFVCRPPLQLPAYLLKGGGQPAFCNRRPRVIQKIIIVLGIIIAWECRDSIIPVTESVITYVIATGSSFIQSV